MSDQEAEELQLHDDEGQMVNRKRHRNNDSATKLESSNWHARTQWNRQQRSLTNDTAVVPNESVLMVLNGLAKDEKMAKDGIHDIEEAFQEEEDREQELRININANFEDIVNDDELLFWEELSFD
uniref:Uncharacterized protein n=1 Tax=Ditylenchus dipsaci TaxID=166011 RepID=A0A915CLB2_9BILA